MTAVGSLNIILPDYQRIEGPFGDLMFSGLLMLLQQIQNISVQQKQRLDGTFSKYNWRSVVAIGASIICANNILWSQNY